MSKEKTAEAPAACQVLQHTDSLATFRPRLRRDWTDSPAISKIGTWAIDACCGRIPWSAEFRRHLEGRQFKPYQIEPGELSMQDQAVTLVRLAVIAAWSAGREALARQRSVRESALVGRKGLPEDIPGIPQALVESVRMELDQFGNPASFPPLFAAAGLGDKLGVNAGVIYQMLEGRAVLDAEVDTWKAEIRSRSIGKLGDRTAHSCGPSSSTSAQVGGGSPDDGRNHSESSPSERTAGAGPGSPSSTSRRRHCAMPPERPYTSRTKLQYRHGSSGRH